MKFGLPISLTLHAAIIGAGVIGLSADAKLSDDLRVIPVKIYTVADVTNIRAAAPTINPAAKPKPAADIAPEPVKPVEIEAPVPVTKADIDPAPRPASSPKAEVSTAPQSPPKPKPLSLDDLSAMVAQSKENSAGNDEPQKLLETERRRIEQAALSRQAQGAGTGLTSAYEDAIMRQIYNAWRIPSGAPDLETLIVTVSVTLDRDGKVATVALTPDSARRAKANSYYRISAESALRAVRDAREFKFLPRAEYDRWRDLTLTFHPKDAPTGVPT